MSPVSVGLGLLLGFAVVLAGWLLLQWSRAGNCVEMIPAPLDHEIDCLPVEVYAPKRGGGREPVSVVVERDKIRAALADFYSEPAEITAWLSRPHPLLRYATADYLIETGKAADVWVVIEQLRSGAYV